MGQDKRYLEKRHDTWHVVVEVPKELRRLAGKVRFKRSLKTDSLAEANRLKHAHVAEFKRRLEALAKGSSDQLAPLMGTALMMRDELARARERGLIVAHPTDDVLRENPHAEPREMGAWEDLALDFISEKRADIAEERGTATAKRFYEVATGKATFIRELSTQWLAERTGQVRESVKQQQAAVINRYLEWAGEHATIEEINRRKAGEFITHLHSGAAGVQSSTARRWVSALSEFWNWLISRGLVDANPWRGHRHPKAKRGRQQLSDSALLSLLTGKADARSQYGDVLHDLIRLALATGARIEELCGLRSIDVQKREDGWWISIREYPGHTVKTDAAERDVPLHDSVAAIGKRLHAVKGAHAFPDLTPGGPDRRRSWNVSRSFSAYRKRVGVKGKAEVFHALRNTFIEAMEGAGVPESTVKLLVGHARASLTFGGYSKGQRVDLREAISRLSYNDAIMSAIAKRGTEEM